MNILLQNPTLLWLMPLIAVPAAIHFLTRAKPPEYPFSAVRFVRKVVSEAVRIQRPKDRLLLLCRTLLFATLLIIFLQPMLLFEEGAAEWRGNRNLLIIIDRSASMAWSEGGRTRFAAACEAAMDLLSGLSSRDTANVVWLDREPDAVFPEMGPNAPYLRESIREGRVVNECGNPAGAMALALEQLADRPGVRELCIISDFQVAQWKDMNLMVPEEIRISTICPVQKAAENGAVLSIRTDPVSPLIGEPTQVICSIANYSASPRNRKVLLEIDGTRIARDVRMPAWGQGTVAVEHVFKGSGGRMIVNAWLDEDAFGADDRQGMIVEVRNSMQVAIAGNNPLTGPVWRRALRSIPWIEMIELTPDNSVDPIRFDLLMLAGAEDLPRNLLNDSTGEEIPVIYSPTPGREIGLTAFLTGTRGFDRTKAVLETLDSSMTLRIAEPNHRAFALFRDGAFGDPAQASFRKRLRIAEADQIGKAILAYRDGEPAVLQCNRKVPAVLWLAPLSPDCGDWAARTPFLSFFGELLQAMRKRSLGQIAEMMETGECLSFKANPQMVKVRLLDESGTEYPVARTDSAAEGIRYVSGPMEKPGIYRLCDGADCASFQIVNFPVRESDLREGTPPLITQGKVRSARNAEELDTARQGFPLWQVLVWLALGLACVESGLVWWMDRGDRGMAVEVR